MPIVRINGLNKSGMNFLSNFFAKMIRNEALTQFTDRAIKENNQTMIKKLFAEFQSVENTF